jgi:Right handed beta helix region
MEPRRREARSSRMRRLLCLLVLGAIAPAAQARTAAQIRVPADAPTLKAAIAQAAPGDTIVLAAGTYAGGDVVPSAKHDVTIEGSDRNRVLLDGENVRKNGIVVHADGVAILNMSARNFRENAFYWKDADRYRGSYLTAWNVQGYGLYAEDAHVGTFDHDYVSGAADAAYYIGDCRPCGATIHDVVATLSAVGYSGTNSTGVVIRDSRWIRNGAGIVPNSYANDPLPPEGRTTIVGNTISGSGRAAVPIHTALAGFIGVGIAIAGGNENVVRRNRVTTSETYGIAVFPTARYVTFAPNAKEPGPPWRPRGNLISGNVVRGSGVADLALATGVGKGNCFRSNSAASAVPRELLRSSCSHAGDATVAAALAAPVRVMFERTMDTRRPPRYSSMPAPPRQPSMPS